MAVGGTTVNYTYNPDGIRTRAKVNGTDIDYLIDPFNHTGYAQVLRADVEGDANVSKPIVRIRRRAFCETHIGIFVLNNEQGSL